MHQEVTEISKLYELNVLLLFLQEIYTFCLSKYIQFLYDQCYFDCQISQVKSILAYSFLLPWKQPKSEMHRILLLKGVQKFSAPGFT